MPTYGLRAVKDALDRAPDRMTPRLQNLAAEAGWPVDLARSLRIEHNEGTFAVYTDPDKQQMVEDLEYGSEGNGPSGVIHAFQYDLKQRQQTAEDIRAEMKDAVREIARYFS